MSRVGRDSFGGYVLDTLAREGIDASCVTVDPRYPTGFQLKSRNDDGSDPTVEYFRKAGREPPVVRRLRGRLRARRAPPAPDGRRAGDLRDVVRAAFKLAREMRAAGKTISFDPNLRPTLWPSADVMAKTLNALASLADWVLPGIAEGRQLTGHDTPADIAGFYLAQGARGVVIKLGAEGAYYRTADGRDGTVTGERVQNVVDTVGAGDGFAVGVVSALLEGRTIEQAVARGNRIGALAIQVIGDSEGLPTRAALDRFENVSNGADRLEETFTAQ